MYIVGGAVAKIHAGTPLVNLCKLVGIFVGANLAQRLGIQARVQVGPYG
jgi:hypothetical protein